MNFKRIIPYLTIAIVTILLLVFIYSAYTVVKKETISAFNRQQMLVAKQTSKVIENFFERFKGELELLSSLDGISDLDINGKAIMQKYYTNRSERIKAITRMDENGRIIFTVPSNRKIIGKDLSYQEHVKYVLKNHSPTVSDIFISVQEYETIAFHMPVIKKGIFRGTIVILIPFEHIIEKSIPFSSKKERYSCENTTIFTKKGNILATTCEKLKESNLKESSLILLKEKIQDNKSGIVTYIIDSKSCPIKKSKYFCAYHSVKLENTYWVVVVMTSEKEILVIMQEFKNKLYLAMSLCLLLVMGTIIILQRNFYIEKEKRMIKATDIVLKRSENKYKSLFEGATDALMLLEKSKGFIDGNRGTIQLFQAPSIEKFKEVNPVILSPKYQPDGISSEKKAAQMIEKAFKNGEHCFEWLHKRFNGEEFPASVQLTRLNWTHRNILLAAVRDMTERNKLEEHLRHNQKMELIGQLAGGFAHDFNNMLNSIGGVGELLQNKYQTDKSTLELVSILTKATEKAASLTGKMLAFSRKAKIITKPLDIHSTIKDAILFLERSINKKIEINKRFTAKKSIVNGDLGQLENAILNICLNASDAMPDGGKISIVTENFEVNNKFSLENELENGTYIKINITDTGTGMDKNTLKHIFEPFFTTKNIGEGTGLGLSAVYGTIKEHKGLLLCESKINHGTIFSIFLPIDENAVVKKTKRNVSVDEKMSKKRILLIDDESIFRKMMEQLLKTINCDVTSAEDGVKGIEIYKEKQAEIDLSIIDQRMPKLTGVETYKKLKEINPEIKVVFISGFTECKEISIVVNEPNVLGFLQKPFKSEELKEILNKA